MNKETSKPKIPARQKRYFALLLLLPLAVYFSFGLHHLTQFETADEHYWIYSNTSNGDYWEYNNGRIEQYWNALLSGNWVKTRINDKPGVTLAYVSGIGSWLRTGLEKQLSQHTIEPLTKSQKAEIINLYFRLPILVFSALLALFLFFLVWKLTGEAWIALFSYTLILLSPILLGISQIVNPDSVLWSISSAALLAFLIFLKSDEKKYALIASICLGFALLTKYSSVIFLPFFFAVMWAYLFENMKGLDAQEISRIVRRHAAAYLLIIAGALAIYAVLLPDNLVEFRHFLKGSIGFKGMNTFFIVIFALDVAILLDAYLFGSKILVWFARKLEPIERYFKIALFIGLPLIFAVIILNTIFHQDLLQLFKFPFDAPPRTVFAKVGLKRIALMQFLPIVFSLSPLVILALFYAWVRNLKKSSLQWIIFVFSFFIVVLVAASIQQKIILSVRYSIMMYPLVFIMASIGLYQLFSLHTRSNVFKLCIFIFSIFVSAVSLWQINPFYFNYASILLPKQYLISDAWGYGGYEAAQVLNSRPDDRRTTRIWSDYNGVCLFYNGKCEANYLTMKNIQNRSTGTPKFEYFVSSRRGSILSKDLWVDLQKRYDSKKIWSSIVGNRPPNFIKIYENKNNAD